jgi:hypothetical protein
VTDLVTRDVQQISDIERPAETLSRYLDLLELDGELAPATRR